MASKALDHWPSSPYCFCKDLPWLVISGLPAVPALVGGWGWEDWATLAAALIALALFLSLLFCLLCLLCPGGLCCGKTSACCGKKKEEKKKLGMTSAQGVEMASFGGSEDSNLTAVDLKLPRAWMDSKGEMEERGDLGVGSGSFGNHNTWASAGGVGSAGLVRRSANSGFDRNRSENFGSARDRSEESRNSRDRFDYSDSNRDRSEYSGRVRNAAIIDDAEDSGRLDYYRNQSATTLMSPNSGGGNSREWERWSTTETRRVEESQQKRHDDVVEEMARVLADRFSSRKDLTDTQSSSHENTASQHTRSEASHAEMSSSNMALVKTSGSGTSGSGGVMTTSGTPIVQCYTVTKKTTTTTYGDEEGDEETAVVTTTEKKWREGMNEVGEISVQAAASIQELLPSIGAPSHLVNDVSNVHTVKSLTTVEGAASDVVRRYEFQQTSRDADAIF